jgi:hypothetical protein
MSRPTWAKDMGQEAHNRGSLEDNYRSNLVNMASRDHNTTDAHRTYGFYLHEGPNLYKPSCSGQIQ